MRPHPDQVIIVSDKPIDTEFEVVIETDIYLSSFRNAGVKAATGTWFIPADLDDEPYPNYCDNLPDADIVAFALQMGDSVWRGNPGYWENALDLSTPNPLVSCSAIKRDLVMQVPYRRVGWEDWALWLDLKRAGARVHFDHKPRFKRNNVAGSLSKIDVAMKDAEIMRLKG
jgi:glycosyltransferase involved in cell wall biosynthesis